MALFDIYGRLRIRVTRSGDRSAVYEIGAEGKRRVRHDVLIPDDAVAADLPAFLEAAFHEMVHPGERIARLD